MPLKREDLRRKPEGGVYVAPARICLTQDDELCDESDPRAVRLLVAAGGELPLAVAQRYGLVETEEPKARAAPEDKQRKAKE